MKSQVIPFTTHGHTQTNPHRRTHVVTQIQKQAYAHPVSQVSFFTVKHDSKDSESCKCLCSPFLEAVCYFTRSY